MCDQLPRETGVLSVRRVKLAIIVVLKVLSAAGKHWRRSSQIYSVLQERIVCLLHEQLDESRKVKTTRRPRGSPSYR